MSDLLVIALGFAVVWAITATRSELDAVSLVTNSLLSCSTVIALVVLFRQARFNRPTRHSELIIFLVAGWHLAMAVPDVDNTLSAFYPHFMDRPLVEWAFWRWSVAGVVTLFVLSLWLLDWRRFPFWIRTTNGTLAFAAMLWGPMQVFRIDFDILQYFRTIDPPFSSLDVVLVELQRAVCLTPTLFSLMLVIGLSLSSFRHDRKQWSWISWFAFALMILAVLGTIVTQAIHLMESTGVWRVAWLIRPAYLALLMYLTVWIVRKMIGRQGTDSHNDATQ